jgi:Cu(I)/Ag(I) efflux system membrane fusion protein
VIVSLGDGHFAAREVRAGAESGDEVEILDGLDGDESVVVSGQFMIDSESQLRSSLRRLDAAPTATTGHEGHRP